MSNIKNFVNYLFDIGIVGINSIKTFLKLYNSKYSHSYSKDLLSHVLYEYFNNLEKNDLQIICVNIINRFIQIKNNDRSKSSKLLLNLYSKHGKFRLRNVFTSWKDKVKIIKNQSTDTIIKNKSQGRIQMKYNKSFSMLPCQINSIQDNKKNMTTKEKLIEAEQKDCTFKPKINKSNKYNTREDPFIRLYKDNEKIEIKKSLLRVQNEEMQKKKNLTFIPTINNTTEENIIKTNFFERQAKFQSSSKTHKENIHKQINEKENSECTFSPQLCKTIQCQYEQPACIRLYEDNARRIQNKKILEKMRILEINKNIKNREKSNYSTEVRTTDDLYFDFKKKEDKIKKLKKSVDFEQGLTFKPNINPSNHIIITSSFNERNERVLEYKKLLSELGNNPISKDKRYTSTEINENNKRVVERLYHRDLDKILSKNQRTVENKLVVDSKYSANCLQDGSFIYHNSPSDQITFNQELKNIKNYDIQNDNIESDIENENRLQTEGDHFLRKVDCNLLKR